MGTVLAIEGIQFQDDRLVTIWEKVLDGRRLETADGILLLETEDFAAVGRMADYAKHRVSGDRVYFVLNRHVNPTNICVLSCEFCDFAKKPGDEGAYELSVTEILQKIWKSSFFGQGAPNRNNSWNQANSTLSKCSKLACVSHPFS